MKQLILLPVILCLLYSCSGLRAISVQVERPSMITIPLEIKSMGILNRSISAPNSGLEATLTLETPLRDKELSEECLRGLKETLFKSQRFVVVRCDTNLFAADDNSLEFGYELPIAFLDSLCKAEKVDAILSMEYFDTDFKVLNPGLTAVNAVGQILSGGSSTVEVRGIANAAAGFRVYHPLRDTIIYEDRFEFEKRWTVQSNNAVDALGKLIQKNDALLQVSYDNGVEFAENIVPLKYWEWRSYFKGKGEMRIAEQQAFSGNWANAIVNWTSAYNMQTKKKKRGKAAFNVALGYEMIGDFKTAQKWIQLAFLDYPKNEVNRYENIIEQRILEQHKLYEQKLGN